MLLLVASLAFYPTATGGGKRAAADYGSFGPEDALGAMVAGA
jgi:hypothetical protein